jgi:hypothetical protein
VNTLKIIEKIATFFSIVSAVFVVLSTISTVKLVQIASSSAPSDYVAIYTLLNALPYLFLMSLSIVVVYITRSAGKEKIEEALPKDEPPQTEEKKAEEDF